MKLRHLLLGRKTMTNLDSVLKSREITLPTNVPLVKAMGFPVALCGCESWTIKKAEHRVIDAFDLWCGEDSWEPLGLRKHPDPALLKKHEKFQVVWHRKAIIKKEKEKLLELFLDKNTKHRKIEGDAKFSEFLSYETSVLTVFIPSSLILIWHLISFRSSQQFIFIIASALATVNSAFYKHYTCLGPSDSLMCRLAFTIICLLCAIWWGS